VVVKSLGRIKLLADKNCPGRYTSVVCPVWSAHHRNWTRPIEMAGGCVYR